MEKESEGPSCLHLRLSAGGARLSIASCASVASLFKQWGNGPLGQTWKKITKNKIAVNHNWTRVCSQSALVTAGSFQSPPPHSRLLASSLLALSLPASVPLQIERATSGHGRRAMKASPVGQIRKKRKKKVQSCNFSSQEVLPKEETWLQTTLSFG